MRRDRRPGYGDGTARLVVDRVNGDYLCYWYTGTGDARLVENARVPSAADAVAWGRTRSPRVRIRTADAVTYWAGTTPRPEGFAHTWTPPGAANAAVSPRGDVASLTGETSDGRARAGQATSGEASC